MSDQPRPQDLYPVVGELTAGLARRADDLAVMRVGCETWDPTGLRADSDSGWGTGETLAAVIDDLGGAEEALRIAVGRLEAAWSALGRLSSD